MVHFLEFGVYGFNLLFVNGGTFPGIWGLWIQFTISNGGTFPGGNWCSNSLATGRYKYNRRVVANTSTSVFLSSFASWPKRFDDRSWCRLRHAGARGSTLAGTQHVSDGFMRGRQELEARNLHHSHSMQTLELGKRRDSDSDTIIILFEMHISGTLQIQVVFCFG